MIYTRLLVGFGALAALAWGAGFAGHAHAQTVGQPVTTCAPVVDNATGTWRTSCAPNVGYADTTPLTPLSVDSTGETATLTTPFANAVAQNVGSKNVYCALGTTASTSGILITPGGGSWNFKVSPTLNKITCITSGADTTTVNIIPGAGSTSGGTSGASSAGGTSNVNITGLNGTAPSTTNPLYTAAPVDVGVTATLTAADANNGSPQTWVDGYTGASINGYTATPTAASSSAQATLSQQAWAVTLTSTAGNSVESIEGSWDGGTHYSPILGLGAITLNSASSPIGSARVVVNTAGFTNIRVRQTTCASSCSTTVTYTYSSNLPNAPQIVYGYDGTNVHALGTTTSGNLKPGDDRCASSDKSFADVSTGTGTGVAVVNGVSAQKIYVCGVSIVTTAAANISLIEGSSSTCGTSNTAGVFLNTGVTASNGAAFAANGGINAGYANSTIAKTASAANYLCVLFTTTNTPTVNVHVSYVQTAS